MKDAGRPKLAQQMQLYPAIDRQNKTENEQDLKRALNGMKWISQAEMGKLMEKFEEYKYKYVICKWLFTSLWFC